MPLHTDEQLMIRHKCRGTTRQPKGAMIAGTPADDGVRRHAERGGWGRLGQELGATLIERITPSSKEGLPC